MIPETAINTSDIKFDVVICPFGVTYYINIQQTSNVLFYSLHVLIFVSIFSAVITLFLNTLVITCILKSSILWTKLYYKGLLYMSATDFLTGAVSFPVFVYLCWSSFARKLDSKNACFLMYIMTITAYTLSSLSSYGAVFLTIERFVKVCYATKYNVVVTNIRAVSLMLILFFFSFTSVVIFITTNSIATTNMYVFICICIWMAVTPSLFYKMVKTVRESRARVCDEQTLRSNAGRLREQKLARTFSIIIICFGFCFAPLCVLHLIINHGRLQGKTEFILFMYFTYFSLSNSLLNPIIYIWQDSVMRKELVEMLKWRKVRIDVARGQENNS